MDELGGRSIQADDTRTVSAGDRTSTGGERPDLEPLIVLLYQPMYDAIAIHSRLGLNLVVDVDHHDAYSIPRGILPNSHDN